MSPPSSNTHLLYYMVYSILFQTLVFLTAKSSCFMLLHLPPQQHLELEVVYSLYANYGNKSNFMNNKLFSWLKWEWTDWMLFWFISNIFFPHCNHSDIELLRHCLPVACWMCGWKSVSTLRGKKIKIILKHYAAWAWWRFLSCLKVIFYL